MSPFGPGKKAFHSSINFTPSCENYSPPFNKETLNSREGLLPLQSLAQREDSLNRELPSQ
jgi:hypothetical protein